MFAMRPATMRAARGIAVVALPSGVAVDRDECGTVGVHVAEKLGRADGEMMKWIPPFATSGASDASEQEVHDVIDADADLWRVVGRIQRVRQQRGQRVVRPDQYDGVSGQLLDLVRSGCR